MVIIGAGAAGLAAARQLAALGLTFRLIEARNRIGGRAYTESTTFGVPYDQGCHWLHSANQNPWLKYARRNGFDVYKAPAERTLYVGDRYVTDAEAKAARNALSKATAAISRAGRRGRDVSPASVIRDRGPWAHVVGNILGPWAMGKDLERFSCTDWYSGAGGEDWFCEQGFGSLISHYGRSVPAELGVEAKRINWNKSGVSVETTRGTIAARAVIVTVPNGVLASGKIKFAPGLPARKVESFHKISMGHYNNIALLFSEDVFDEGEDALINYRSNTRKSVGILSNSNGDYLSLAFTGGTHAAELENAGVAAAVDFGLGEIVRMLGSSVRRKFLKGNYTRWGLDPYSIGAYASAEPGYAHLRRALRQPVGNRIFFAGEACHRSLWSTAAGAHLSGQATARAVKKAL
ncbi:MAG: NAD(P)/FAD-dependent oxidoreductase [Pseudomonadota bacterium]